MIRQKLIANNVGLDKEFRLRGSDVSRVEGFSDAVFGFSVTLVVVSLEVPTTFDQLQQTVIHGFFSFAICFAMLIGVWQEHYKYFRRYGLGDAFTVSLNMILLFVILFYIYPLKFLFNLISDSIFFPAEASNAIQNQQWPALMMIYGAGFIAVYIVFLLLFVHAYRKRQELELNESEITITMTSILSTVLVICVGLTSLLIAAFGGEKLVSWSGWVYLLIIPAHIGANRVTRRFRKARQEKVQLNPAPDDSNTIAR